jgi:hypothetical protein
VPIGATHLKKNRSFNRPIENLEDETADIYGGVMAPIGMPLPKHNTREVYRLANGRFA